MNIRSYIFLLVVIFRGLAPGGELEVVESNNQIRLEALPSAAFFESSLSCQVRLNGQEESVAEDSSVIGAIFQRAGKRLVPLSEPSEVGTFAVDKSGSLVADIEIPIPKLQKPVEMVLRIQAEGTKLGKTIEFQAMADDLLHALVERGVRATHAETVKKAFKDRDLKISEKKPSEIAKKWRGIWFIHLEGDDRSNFTVPDQLDADQLVVLLEAPSSWNTIPLARNRGEGWVVQMPADWFKDFSTNAGAQLAFMKTIDKLSIK